MADVKLYFLGEEYTVPSELREFVGYLNDFDEIRNEVMSLPTARVSTIWECASGLSRPFR